MVDGTKEKEDFVNIKDKVKIEDAVAEQLMAH